MENKKNIEVKQILFDLKYDRITYEDATKKLDSFSKEELMLWILKEFKPQPNPDITSIKVRFDEHQQNLPSENPYHNIKM